MATGGSSLSKLTEETFDFICTACDKANRTSEAVRYCVECSGYCCRECTDLHSRFPALENHNLLDVGQGNRASKKQPKLPEFSTERCNIHQGKVLDMYCEHHDVVGCSICISTNHRSCPDGKIHFIPGMIDSLFNISRSRQVHTNLKDLMVPLTRSSRNKDDQLAILRDSKDEALEKVAKFQKALESIIKKLAEMSRQEVEEMYNNIEKEILQEKTDLMKINDSLQEVRHKLEKAVGNRAQHFVCTNIAEKRITETEMARQKKDGNADVKLSFTPNQSLIDYINGLQSIGEVCTISRLKEDLYKVKESKDINIKMPSDNFSIGYFSNCCQTYDNHILVTDYNNSRLKLIDTQTLLVVGHCDLDCQPWGVCCINAHEAAVTCKNKKIQIVSINGNMMKPTRQIKVSHNCFGIASKDDKLYITDVGQSLYIHDMGGNLLKAITNDNAGNRLFSESRRITVSKSRNKIFVSDWKKGILCFDDGANYLSTFHDCDLIHADGVFLDGKGNIFVVGSNSHNVIQFNEEGRKLGVVLRQEDGIKCPNSVCFDKKRDRLFLTMDERSTIKMFELK